MLALGIPAKILDGDLVEFGQEGLRGLVHRRGDNLVDQGGDRRRIILAGGIGHRRAYDVADADAPPLAGQFMAAPRTAHPLENIVAHQGLQQGFQMARRQGMLDLETYNSESGEAVLVDT